ncbi:MAG: aminopeptidase P family protein [Acidobacteria bacterium]|nr:aminopeptidase P family protein [Acidobacteriota bacterium]
MKRRRDLVRERLGDLGVDALLVTDPLNVRYLTGFTGSSAQLVVAGEDVFLTDPRYEEQSLREVSGCRFQIYQGERMVAAVAAAIGSLGATRIGVEAENLTLAGSHRLAKALGTAPLLTETTGVVEDLRLRKDEAEIELLRRACAVGDAALESLLAELREGMTEREVAMALDDAVRSRGSEAPSFETIAAFGESASEPHHRPTDRGLRRGDMVELDFGAVVGGYHSDMTRTIAFGDPSEEMARVYALVRAGQSAGIEAVAAGVTAGAVDAATRAPIVAGGFDYGHGTGHGVGLDVHEPPALRRDAADILAPGTAVTVEPGIYLPGTGGVRIEDLVVVRDAGCEVLTTFPKELIKV